MNSLTETQQKVYHYICHYIKQHGKSPLLPEIAKGIGIKSIGSVHKHVQALVENGFIEIIAHRHRGIRLIDHVEPNQLQIKHQAIANKALGTMREQKTSNLTAIMHSLDNLQQHLKHMLTNEALPAASQFTHAPQQTTLPLLGKIAAGQPIEAIPNEQDLDLASFFIGKNLYALQVVGDSMIDEGIHDGDKVICEQRDTAKNGDIVVALIDQENATLKKLKHNGDNTITLIPANPALSPIVYAADRITIQGVLVGVVRLHRTRH